MDIIQPSCIQSPLHGRSCLLFNYFLPLWAAFTLEAQAPVKNSAIMAPERVEREGGEPGVVALSHCAEQKYEEMNSGTGSLVT